MRTVDPEQQSERREQILDAAVTAFAREGFHKASMTDIAAAAGMSAGNLYRYFKSKDVIIQAMAERERRESNKLMAELAAAPDLVEALAEAVVSLVMTVKLEKAIVDLEIMAESARNPELAKLFLKLEKEVHAQLAGALRNGQRSGQVSRAIDVNAAARLLIDLSYGLSGSGIGSTPKERTALAAEVRRLIRAYLSAGGG
jgi:AcrR family transcriptional regulator